MNSEIAPDRHSRLEVQDVVVDPPDQSKPAVHEYAL